MLKNSTILTEDEKNELRPYNNYAEINPSDKAVNDMINAEENRRVKQCEYCEKKMDDQKKRRKYHIPLCDNCRIKYMEMDRIIRKHYFFGRGF